MYDHIREETLFIMLYTAVTTMALMASCYLLFRRGNAFAPDITTPVRLRRWTGVFFASIALNHVWYMPFLFLTSCEDIMLANLIGGMLDSMTVLPLSIVVMFAMLQDRRLPLWPIAVATAPITIGMAACVVMGGEALYPVIYAYVMLLAIAVIGYMVRALRQYGRWLRDNYADLEHKEVWQSFVVLAIILSTFTVYELCDEGSTYLYALQAISVVLIGYLLWRVETLSDLSLPAQDTEEARDSLNSPADPHHYPSPTIRNDIGRLLRLYCEEPQLYLQYDFTVTQLAQQIGTNRSYLSKHFALQGTTYNAYINGLRIQHFIRLYQEAATTQQSVTAQQLAYQSGFRSYNTFSVAFKKIMGMTATEWMRNVAG